ncbi:DNA replication and repair protein RecF [Sporomusa carbonis]|uniref:AAA family ATPase n=1 Tax=Sporomusa carbonis TaxID=3076075 RepID=UPI003A74BA90
MQLQSIVIKNFKGIKDIAVNFKAGFNILIGDNGVGKTSILEAISVGLGGFLAGVNETNTKHISQDEVRLESKLTGDGSINIKQEYPVKVECTAILDNHEFTWVRQKKTLKGRTTVEPRDICRFSKEMLDDTDKIAPLINYQSAARMWAQKREKTTNVFQENYTRSVGYIDCLAEESNAKMLLNWCKRMEEIAWQEDKKISEYEAVKDAIVTFMSIMSEKPVKGVRFHKRTGQLVYSINEEENIPVHLLSSGYQSVIWMVMDIAYRMAVLNPDLRKEVTKKTPGIVLIDELDLHLHPKWQWKIVEALKATFPCVQFITTTHSPLIIASCKNEQLITIGNDMEIGYSTSAYGHQVGHVLSYLQDSYDRAKAVKDKFDGFYQAIDDEKFKEAQCILDELLLELDDTNPDIVKAKTTLELETAFLGD